MSDAMLFLIVYSATQITVYVGLTLFFRRRLRRDG